MVRKQEDDHKTAAAEGDKQREMLYDVTCGD